MARAGNGWVVVVMVSAAAAGACQKHAARPLTAAQFGDAPVVRAGPRAAPKPEWWSDGPLVQGTMVSVCASAEDADLLTARRAAVAKATAAFRGATGRAPTEGAMQVDSVRLEDGRFRAYVRVSGPAEREMASPGR